MLALMSELFVPENTRRIRFFFQWYLSKQNNSARWSK